MTKTLPKKSYFDNLLPISEAAEFLGVSIDTLRRWDKKGKMRSVRPNGKDRFFNLKDLQKVKLNSPLNITEAAEKLKLSVSTLRRLEEKGLINPKRDVNSVRLYDQNTINDFLNSDHYRSRETTKIKGDLEPLSIVPVEVELYKVEGEVQGLVSFKRTVISSVLSLVSLFLILVLGITAFFLIVPTQASTFFGYKNLPIKQIKKTGELVSEINADVLGLSDGQRMSPMVLGKVLKPLTPIPLSLVKVIDPEKYKIIVPPIKSITDVFAFDEEGKIVTLRDVGFVPVSEEDVIGKVDAYYLRGHGIGSGAGDLVLFGESNTIPGVKIGGGDLLDSAVSGGTGGVITDSSITSLDLAVGSVLSSTILDGSISEVDLGDGIITSEKIADEGVTTDDIKNNTITASDLARVLTFGGTDFIDLGSIGHSSSTLQGLRLPNVSSATPTSPESGEGFLSFDTSGNQVIVYNGSSWAPIGGSISLYTGSDDTSTTDSSSGLELINTDEISLIRGCADTQVLKWNDTLKNWYCDDDSGASGSGITTIQENDTNIVTSAATIDFLGSDFEVSNTGGGEGDIAIDYASSGITRTGSTATIAAAWTVGTGGSLATSGSGTITATDLSCTNCIGPTEITDLALGTDTSGNYVATGASGSGVSLTGGGSEGATLTAALAALTADWNQTGAFDIVLGNASAELRILESVGGAFYGTLDIGDLAAADATYTFSGTSGTVLTSTNVSGTLSGWDQDSSDDLTTGNYAATLDSVYVNVGESPAAGDVAGSFSGGLTLGSNTVDDTELVDSLTYTGAFSVGNLTISDTTVPLTGASFTFDFNNGSDRTLTIANSGAGTANLAVDGTISASNFSGTSSGTNTGDQNLYSTINAPNGTDPVAGTTSDTLNFSDGTGITITGTAASDTISIAATLGISISNSELDNDTINFDKIATSLTLDEETTISAGSALNLLIGSNATLTTTGSGAIIATDLSCTNCIGATEISDLALGTDTSGNYVLTGASGSGVSLTGGGSEGATLTADLAALTEDWAQSGAFDIVLGNASSELKILESVGGAFYGIFDVGDLAADATYTFSGTSGTVLTSANVAASLSGWDQDSSDDLTTGNYAATLDSIYVNAGESPAAGDISGSFSGGLNLGSNTVDDTELVDSLTYTGALSVGNLTISDTNIPLTGASLTFDFNNAADRTLTIANSGAGTAHISVDGSLSASNFSGSSSGTNTGDQTITLEGDVTGSGTGTFTTTIADNSVELGDDTTGNYVSSATVGGGLALSGTEGASLGIRVDCGTGDVVQWDGDSWECDPDDSGGGGSLDAAYNGGGTITVDAYDVLFNLSDATNDYNFAIDNATNATIDSAISITTLGGGSSVFTTAIDLSDAGIGAAIAIGTNDITTAATTIASTELDILDAGILLSELTDSGTLTAGTVDINGGAIDGTTIGGSVAGAGTFTTLVTTSTLDVASTIQAGSGNITLTDSTGNILHDALVACSDGQILKYIDATDDWECATDQTAVGGASTLQESYEAGATVSVTSGEGALVIDLTSANFDIKVGESTDTGDFRIYDGTDNWIFIDESGDTLALGAAAGSGVTIGGAGITTTNAGALTVSETLTLSNNTLSCTACIDITDIGANAVDDSELVDALTYTGALTLSQNLNADGGLDVDDAFVVGDGGSVTTISIGDTNIPFTGGNTTFDLNAVSTRTLTITNSDGSNVADLAVEGAISASNFSGTSSGTNTGDQNIFLTINAPNGTDPVADGTSDTLNFLDGSGITITGDVDADSITIASTLGTSISNTELDNDTINFDKIATALTLDEETTISAGGALNLLIGNNVTLTTTGTGAIIATDLSCTNCIGATEIADLALGTDTSGNYVLTGASGSGVSLTGGGSEGATLTADLTDLTADWDQAGAFDIVLNSSSSELKILESGGTPTLFGIFDVGDLSGSDSTFTFSGTSGTVLTTANYTTTLDSAYVNVAESPAAGDVAGSFSGGLTLGSNTVDDTELVDSLTYTGSLSVGNLTISDTDIPLTGSALTLDFNNASDRTLTIANSGAGTAHLSVDGTISGSNFSGTSSGTNTGDQNVFLTINAPNGTDPVADGASDTLNFLDGSGITITGDVDADSVTIASTLGTSISNTELDNDTINFDKIATALTLDEETTLSAGGALNFLIGNNVTFTTTGTGAIIATDLTCTNCIGPTEITDLTLGTDTAGNYVAAATVGGGLELTGTEGATLGIRTDCGTNEIVKWDGDSWECAIDETAVGGAGSLQESYETGATISVTTGEGALVFDLTSANFDIKVGESTDTGDFRIYDGTDNWIFIDESADTLSLGAAAGSGVSIGASGVTTTNAGALTVSETLTLSNNTLSCTACIDVTDIGANAVDDSELVDALSYTGALTLTQNLNANGGLDVDDAFVVDDGGAVSVLSISDTNVPLTGTSFTLAFNAAATRTLTITNSDGSNVADLAVEGAISASNFSGSSSGTNTGDQTITLEGDVTGSGTGTFTTTIADNSVDGTDIAIASQATGDIMYYNGTDWVRLAVGTGAECLKGGAVPEWGACGGGSGSLDDAYNNGATITVDAADVLFDLNDGTNDYGIVIDNNTASAIATALEFTNAGGGGFTNEIVLQNGETISNLNDNQINLGLGTSGTLLLTSGTAASITNSAGTLTIDSVGDSVLLGAADSLGNGTWSISSAGLGTALTANDLSCTNCIGATEISDLALGTDTSGNYVLTGASGSGVSLTGGGSEGATLTADLVALTGDWDQTGAFDVVLNNSSSELKILESGGTPTLFGIFDVGDLSGSDSTFTFSGTSGTVLTSANYTGTLDSVYVNVAESPAAGDIAGSFSGGLTLGSNTVDDTELVDTLTYTGALSVGNLTISDTSVPLTGASFTFDFNNASDRTLTIANSGAGTSHLSVDGTISGSNFSGSSSGTNTGDQTITLEGDVTGSGTGTFTATIADNSVDGTDIAIASQATGDIMYYNGTDWVRLAVGTGAECLKGGAVPEWGACGGGSGSLDDAYNNGATITVDAADILFNLSDATNDYNLVIDNATDATIDAALSITTLGGASSVFTTALDVSDAGIVTALAIGANDITTAATTISSTELDLLDGGVGLSELSDLTAATAIAANGGITFDSAADTLGAHTLAGTLDSATQLILNIGNAGTDFDSGGGLTLASTLVLSNNTLTCTACIDATDIGSNAVDDSELADTISYTGTLTIASNALAVNSDSITSDGVLTIDGTSAVVLGTGTNGFRVDETWSSSTSGFTGTARPPVKVTLVPEYQGAVLTGTGSGTMTSDFCSEDGLRNINSAATPTDAAPCDNDVAGEEHNYYSWDQSGGSSQVYNVWVRWQVPADFAGFAASNAVQAYGWRTDSTVNETRVFMYDTGGTLDNTSGTVVSTSTTPPAWTLTTVESTPGGTYTVGSYVTFQIQMTADTGTDTVKAGEILINYLAKF